jgi:hypothetical protein
MKKNNRIATADYRAERVSFCSVAAEERQTIEIAGQTLRPNEDTAYVEFFLSHAYPVTNKWRTGILPEVVGNSYLTLQHKVFNLAHIMRSYDPKSHPRDRVLGTVVAVEFGRMVEGVWTLGAGEGLAADKANAPGVRAVAAMHKAAENAIDILASWFAADDTSAHQEWSVSIENNLFIEDGGFLVKGDCARAGKDSLLGWVDTTPAALTALGYVYIPTMEAPEKLLACLNDDDDDEREKVTSTRICRDYYQLETIFLMGGLNGAIRYRGVGLTPAGGAREREARVGTMLASDAMVDLGEMVRTFADFGKHL